MTELIMLAVILAAYYLSYIFSLTAGGLFLSDYDESKFLNVASSHKKKYLSFLINNTKQVGATADIVRSTALTLTTILLFLIGFRFTDTPLTSYITGATLAVLGLVSYLILNDLIAPNVRQERVAKLVASRWLLIQLLMAICAPLARSMISLRTKLIDEQQLEDKKEEIVERAIESLADSAGIDEPLLEEDERQMIENIFDLGETEVLEVMVPRVDMVAIEIGTSLPEIQKVAAESGFSRFPVYREDMDDICGIVYLKDIFPDIAGSPADIDLMKHVRPPYYVPESKKLDSLLEEFRSRHVHIAIVVDEFGGTAGLVTLEDLIESIVGDIQDEHDTEEAELVKVADNIYLVDANMSMEELSEELDLALPDKEFETVGGYIYDLVGSLPKVGQKIETEKLDLVVECIKGQRIEKVRLFIKPSQSESQE